jgi:hypothetical protein
MSPSLILPVALAASLCLGASGSAPASATSGPLTSGNASASTAALDCSERAALQQAQSRDADLCELKAGFALSDNDTSLVLGTVAVVVLIVLLV